MSPDVYAWTNGMSAFQVEADLARFPGVGAVLYPYNYAVARKLDRPSIAFVKNAAQARTIRLMLNENPRMFRAVLVEDERNVPGPGGPSGPFIPPLEYEHLYAPIYKDLHGRVPVYTMGLSPLRDFWKDLTHTRKFDDVYHMQLPNADGRAFNPNGVQLSEVERVLGTYDSHPWLLSPAPFRAWWDRMLEPISVSKWVELSKRPNVTVAFWNLRETRWADNTFQTQHGLLRRCGLISPVGREVLRAMEAE